MIVRGRSIGSGIDFSLGAMVSAHVRLNLIWLYRFNSTLPPVLRS